jgi:uncharacterized membrane protein HdeD (DUF308 family)
MMEDNWVWRLITGLTLIVLGVLLLTYTGITLLILLELFGIIMIFVGFVEILFGISTPRGTVHRWLFVFRGFLSLIIGWLAVLLPGVTLVAAIYLLAAWAIVWGVLELTAALVVPEDLKLHVYGNKGRWFALIAGFFAIILGLAIVAYPEPSLDLIVLVFGVVVIVIGLFTAISGFHSRNKRKDWPEGRIAMK